MVMTRNLGKCDCCGCFPCGLTGPVSEDLPDLMHLTLSGLPGFDCCAGTVDGGLVNGFAYPLVRINEDQWQYFETNGADCAIVLTVSCVSDPETDTRGLSLSVSAIWSGDGESGLSCFSGAFSPVGGGNSCDPLAWTWTLVASPGCGTGTCDADGATAVLAI